MSSSNTVTTPSTQIVRSTSTPQATTKTGNNSTQEEMQFLALIKAADLNQPGAQDKLIAILREQPGRLDPYFYEVIKNNAAIREAILADQQLAPIFKRLAENDTEAHPQDGYVTPEEMQQVFFDQLAARANFQKSICAREKLTDQLSNPIEIDPLDPASVEEARSQAVENCHEPAMEAALATVLPK